MRRLTVGAVFALAACSTPPPRSSADTDHVATRAGPAPTQRAQYVRSCPPTPPIPPVARAVFDLYLGAAQATRIPSNADIAVIERLGGKALHRFHVDAIRAELDTGAARALVSGPDSIAFMATQVLDTAQLTIPLQIFYSRPLTADDSSFIAHLSGLPGPTIRGPRAVIYTELPDSLLPLVLRAPGVKFARARAFGCGHHGSRGPVPVSSGSSRLPQN
jgi:hypothetical protein